MFDSCTNEREDERNLPRNNPNYLERQLHLEPRIYPREAIVQQPLLSLRGEFDEQDRVGVHENHSKGRHIKDKVTCHQGVYEASGTRDALVIEGKVLPDDVPHIWSRQYVPIFDDRGPAPSSEQRRLLQCNLTIFQRTERDERSADTGRDAFGALVQAMKEAVNVQAAVLPHELVMILPEIIVRNADKQDAAREEALEGLSDGIFIAFTAGDPLHQH
mmetsp:Transcript_23487/g.58440  ORF Transcript_23487/g.58440 Transcript_23487/m.58440 type:complete len:217 (-) Transcript_23487:692-1342(-)